MPGKTAMIRCAELGLTSLGAVLLALATVPAATDLMTSGAPPTLRAAVLITSAACLATLGAILVPAGSLARAYALRAPAVVLLPMAATAHGGQRQALLLVADVILLVALLLVTTRVLTARSQPPVVGSQRSNVT